MIQTILIILANWFSRTESNLRKHLCIPRDHLADVERQLSLQLGRHFRGRRRTG
jgi:hypothetical protein